MGAHLSALRALAPAPALAKAAFIARLAVSPGYRRAQFDALQQAGSALAAKHTTAHPASFHSFRAVSAMSAARRWAAAPSEPSVAEYLARYEVFARLAAMDDAHATIERARARSRGQGRRAPLPRQMREGDALRVLRAVYAVPADAAIVAPGLDPAAVQSDLDARVQHALRAPASPAARVAAHTPIASVRSLVSAVVGATRGLCAEGQLVRTALLPAGGTHRAALASTLAFLGVYEALWRAALDAAPAAQRHAAFCALSRGAVLDVLVADLAPWRAAGGRGPDDWAKSVYFRSRASGLLHALGACGCGAAADCRDFPAARRKHNVSPV